MHPNRRRHAEALGRRPARERDFIPGEGPTCASQQCWSSLGSHNRFLSRMSYIVVSLIAIEFHCGMSRTKLGPKS